MTGISVSSRYLLAKAIADGSFERPLSERAEWITAQCAGDDQLHNEVTWLLQAAAVTTPLGIEYSVPVVPWAPLGDRIEAPAPRNYRIIRCIGRGGMGVVYLAERVEGAYTQTVALKFLSVDSAPPASMLERLLSERQILAGLNHPNIAHLIDGGSSADGRPFLAMEYIEGETLNEWCARRDASLRERVRIFIKVCHAVAYAHQHLVIHRDLKPTNVLVNAEGEPKLLDFGIARILEEDASVRQTRTEVDQRILTLGYASPEQVQGQPLSTATDVYSLGAVLYELVSGARPYGHITSTLQLSNAIVSGQLVAPSRSSASEERSDRDYGGAIAKQRRADRRIPRDIDAIVLKAMRPSPAERYQTVNDLTEDLQRFLTSRAVTARRGEWSYRARRFAYRHRWVLGAAAVLLVLLGALEVQRELRLRQTELERGRAKDALTFMQSMLDNADLMQTKGSKLSFQEIVDAAAKQISESHGMDTDVRGAMLSYLGHLYLDLGAFPRSEAMLKQAVASFRESQERKVHALLYLGDVQMRQGNYPQMMPWYEQAVSLARSLPQDDIDNYVAYVDALNAYAQAQTLAKLREPKPLIEEWQQILTMLAEKPIPGDRTRELFALEGLANVYLQLEEDPESAIPILRRALAIYRQQNALATPPALHARFSLARALNLEGNGQEALPEFKALAADWARYAGPDSVERAVVLSDYASALDGPRRYAEEVAALQEAARITAKNSGADGIQTMIIRTNLGRALVKQGDLDQAQAVFSDIVARAEPHGSDPVYQEARARNLGSLAEVALLRGDASSASSLVAQGFKALHGIEKRSTSTYAYLLSVQGETQLLQKNYAAAERTAQLMGSTGGQAIQFLRQRLSALAMLGQPEKQAQGNAMLAEMLAQSRRTNGECNMQTLILEHPQEPIHLKIMALDLPAKCKTTPAAH